MLGRCVLTTAGNSKRSLRCNVQNETKLIFELFGEPTTNESVKNRTNGARVLRLR